MRTGRWSSLSTRRSGSGPTSRLDVNTLPPIHDPEPPKAEGPILQGSDQPAA